jgi:glutathione S-transferase
MYSPFRQLLLPLAKRSSAPQVLNESNSILSYIADKWGRSKGLYPETAEQLALAWQWLEFGEQYLVPRTNPVRIISVYEYPFDPETLG